MDYYTQALTPTEAPPTLTEFRHSPVFNPESRQLHFSPVTPQAATVLAHMKAAGGITQREALADHSVQSLTRRITELRDAGFKIKREFKFHPITRQRYARYSLEAN